MISIGTSGYSYKEWKEHFYPKKLRPGDYLSFYSKYFKATEINSTYYNIPPPQLFDALLEKAPDNFEFVVKTPKEYTHLREKFNESIDLFNNSIAPLVKEKKLSTLLAQFPFSFKPNDVSFDHLKALRKSTKLPINVEFRNIEWIKDEVIEFLKKNNLGYVNVDMPALPKLLPFSDIATTDIGYIRFHGRNSKSWWIAEQAYQRYDYLYKKEELKEKIPQIKKLEKKTKKLFIFMNNHWKAKAVLNASELGNMLDIFNEDIPVTVDLGEVKHKSIFDF